MEKPILISLIMTYNHKDHIARCIESQLAQKTSYKFEIRIYDDCSNDGTTDICREYAAKYPDKIKLIVQKENTFLKPYNQMQSYKAIQDLDAKYFCLIDGDDCWCDENKVQVALDFLENNPEYIGFAHDTKVINLYTGKESSYVHELGKWNDIKNPMPLAAEPYYFTSSRVFRNVGFKDKKIIPVDYLIYFYHAQKGPIYYYDKIMANYYVSIYNTFSNVESNEQMFLCSTFGYKIAKFFDYKEDKLAMGAQAYYKKETCETIEKYKKIFGIKWGWNIWYFITFVPVFGLEVFDLNWVCPRKLIKKRADNRAYEEIKRLKRMQKYKNKIEKYIGKKDLQIRVLSKTLDYAGNGNFLRSKISLAIQKKQSKIEKIKTELDFQNNCIEKQIKLIDDIKARSGKNV